MCANYIGPHRVYPVLCRLDLGVSLVNSGKRARDARVFEFPLTAVVFDGRFGRFDSCHGLCDLRRVVIILKRNQKVALVNLLEV